MNTTSLGSFWVMGIEARTSNSAEMGFDGVIPGMWDRLMYEGMLAAIPNRVDSEVIALYCDYESDDSGMYTFVLGARVTSAEGMPEGMVAREVPAGPYAVFESARGPVARIVFETWQKIWKARELARSYQFDFEVYGAGAADPRDSQIQIYVGVKES